MPATFLLWRELQAIRRAFRLVDWICKEWRFVLILLLTIAAVGVAWVFEFGTTRPSCKAADALYAGEFLVPNDLQGNNVQALAGKFLRSAKSKGEAIDSGEVCALDVAQAVLPVQIVKRQFVPGVFRRGVCLDAWNVSDSKILASDLRIVALTPSSEEVQVYLLMSRAQAGVDLNNASKIRFAVVACGQQRDPCATATSGPNSMSTPTAFAAPSSTASP